MIQINQYRQRLKRLAVRAVCLMMVSLVVWSGAWVPGAIALGSESASDVLNSRAAAELDRMSGEGTSDRLEGAVQETTGKVKRGVGEVTGQYEGTAKQAEGAADQLKGSVKRDVGKAKGAAADVGDDIQDKADGVVESIKDFFDR